MTEEFSKPQQIILELLDSPPRRAWYGLELIKSSDGKLRMSNIFFNLAGLENRGFVSSEIIEADNDGQPTLARRKYSLTEGGRRMWLSHKNASNTPSADWGLQGLNPA